MSATSVSGGNLHKYLKKIVTLLEEIRDELKEQNRRAKSIGQSAPVLPNPHQQILSCTEKSTK